MTSQRHLYKHWPHYFKPWSWWLCVSVTKPSSALVSGRFCFTPHRAAGPGDILKRGGMIKWWRSAVATPWTHCSIPPHHTHLTWWKTPEQRAHDVTWETSIYTHTLNLICTRPINKELTAETNTKLISLQKKKDLKSGGHKFYYPLNSNAEVE